MAACPLSYRLSDRVLLVPDECVATATDALAIGANAWNAHGAHFVFLGHGAYDAVLSMECGDATGFVGQYEYSIVTEPKITMERGFWLDAGADDQAEVAMHELGHALGAHHVLDNYAVMFWSLHGFLGMGTPSLDASDLADLSCVQFGEGCADAGFDPAH